MSVVYILYTVSRQYVILVLRVLYHLVDLLLGHEFTAISLRVEHKHSWIDEAFHKGVFAHSNCLNISISFKYIVWHSDIPVRILLPVFIIQFFNIILTVKGVLEGFVVILASDVH